jgi:predicted lactoylglutathione lyase
MDQRLSLVTLGVADVAAATAFYERLGWKRSVANSNDDVTFFQLGGIILGLYGAQALADDIGIEYADRIGFNSVTLAYNARSKEEVDQVLADAAVAGANLVKPAADAFWGGYSGYFSDPDGHHWEVAWNPIFPIDDTGAITLPE